MDKQEQRLGELSEEVRAQGHRAPSVRDNKIADGSMDTSFLNTLSNASITRDANQQSVSRASDKKTASKSRNPVKNSTLGSHSKLH